MIHKLYVAAVVCALWATSAQAQSSLTSYVSQDGGEHVVYESAFQHIHQLLYDANNNWTNQDLTSLTGAPLAATGSALTSFAANGQQHIFYLDANGFVQHLLYTGALWEFLGISQSGGAASGSALTGWANCSGGQHVAYLDGNRHVQMLYYDGSNWSQTDLTSLTGSPVAISGSPLTSYKSADCNDHVNFLGPNGPQTALYGFFYSGRWFWQSLMGDVDSNTQLTSFDDCHGEHVVYELFTKIEQAYYNGSGWTNQVLGGNPASGTPLTSFAGGSCDEHIFLLSTNPIHVHQLYFNGSWNYQDLGSGPSPGSPLTSFDDSHGQHVVFINAGGIFQLYYNGSWQFQHIGNF